MLTLHLIIDRLLALLMDYGVRSLLVFFPPVVIISSLTGFGGVVSPLVCQALVANGTPWFHFYFGSLVLSTVNVSFLTITFKPTTKAFLEERGVVLIEAGRLDSPSILPSPVSDTKSQYSDDTEEHIPPPRNSERYIKACYS